MTEKVYVVLQDVSMDLGEGYSSAWAGELICVVSTFEKARNKIEELAEKDGYGTEEVVVFDEDWDFIKLGLSDIYNTNVRYYFKLIEVE